MANTPYKFQSYTEKYCPLGHRHHTLSHLIHSVKRASERYGVALDDADYHSINDLVKHGKAQRMSNSPHRSLYFVHFRCVDMVPVFDNRCGNVVTFLPLDDRTYVAYKKLMKTVEIKRI